MDINTEVIKIITATKNLYVPVKESSDLYRDLDFDSLEFIQLIIKIEETYSINFDLLEMDQCLQVGRLIKAVEHKLEVAGT